MESEINLEFSLIMSLDILQNDWTRLDKDFSYKFQGEKQNRDWPGWSGFGRFCRHKIVHKKLCQKFRETRLQKWNLKIPIFEDFGQNHKSKIERESADVIKSQNWNLEF